MFPSALADGTVEKVTDFTQKQLEYAANVSFAAYCLTFLFIAVLIILAIHFFWIVHPNSKSQRECNQKIAEAVQMFSVKIEVMDDLKDLSTRIVDDLANIEKLHAMNKCPIIDQRRLEDLLQPRRTAPTKIEPVLAAEASHAGAQPA